MKHWIALGLLSLGCCQAQVFKPANIMSSDKRITTDQTYDPSPFTATYVGENFDYLATIKGPPTAATLYYHCKQAVLEILKAPATAKFVNKPNPGAVYYAKAGIYVSTGKVDSQNSYGALLRADFLCYTVYSGNKTSGTLLIDADLLE